MPRNRTNVAITATDKTKAAFASAQRNIAGLQKRVLSMRGSLLALGGLAGFGAVIRSSTETAEKIDNLSQSLGVSTEAASQYRLVAARSGTTLDNLSLIWQRQSRRVAEAAVGTGEARDALRELGLEATELAKLSPDRQFEVIADAMQNVENQSDKLRLAFKLFDSEGARPALQAMEAGSEGLQQWRKDADDLGLTLTSVESKELKAFRIEMEEAKLRMVAAGEELSMRLIPLLTTLYDRLADAGSAAADFFDKFDRPDLDTLDEQVDALGRFSREYLRIQEQIENGEFEGPQLEGMERRLEELTDVLIPRARKALAEFAKAPEDGEGGTPFDIGKSQETIAAEKAAQLAAERAAKEEQRLRDSLQKRLEIITNANLTEQEQLDEQLEERLFTLEEAYQEELISWNKLQEEKLKAEAQFGEKSKQQEKKNSATVVKLREQVASQTINILRQLGGKSKAFAAAAILLESTIAAKKIFIESQVAAAAALVPPPVGLGPVAGQPLAASILAMGKISAGLTLATGALQLSSLGGQGAAGNFAAEPTFEADPLTGLPTGGAAQTQLRTDININIGDAQFLSADAVRILIEQINEQIDDGVNVGSIGLV